MKAGNQYWVWNTDTSGNYASAPVGPVAGTNQALETIETSFNRKRCSQATALSWRGRVGPRQQVVDLALGVAGDDAGDDVGEVGIGIDAVELAVSMSEAIVAQCSAPPSEPAKSAFFLLRAIGRMERSTTLLSISTVPSSRKRHRPAQRESA